MKTVEFRNEVYVVDRFDVLVAGGGTAGVCAAVSAARSGAKVCLIEQSAMLGGIGTSGMMTALIGPKNFFGGIGKEIVTELKNQNAIYYSERNNIWAPYQNEAMKSVLDQLVLENNVTLYLYTKVVGVIKEHNILKSVILSSIEGNFAIEASIFIDTTGDGNLSLFAGEKFMAGDENGNVQAPTMTAYYSNIDFDKTNCFTQENGGNRDKIIQSLLPQAIKDGVIRVEDMHHPGVFQVGEDYGVANCGHIYGANCFTAKGLTSATIEGRKLAKEYFEFYKRYIPGFENARYITTASYLGIRESRRVIGRHICDYNDKIHYTKYVDGILRYEGGPATDMHSSSADKKSYQEYYKMYTAQAKNDELPAQPWTDMPYRALLAKETDNLLVAGRCVSSDRFVLAQIRVMGYCMMMGQAAGTTAAMCAKDQIISSKVNIAELQKKLQQSGILNK